MKKNVVIQMPKGLAVSYVISGLVLLLLAFLMYKNDLGEGVVRGVILFAYVISCFIGGMVVNTKRTQRCYLWGMLQGILYYVVLIGVSMVFNRVLVNEIQGALPAFFLCAFGGMLGGMMQAGRK